MPDMYTPGSWEDFNRRKAADARTGIGGQTAIIPRMIKWLIGQGVPEEEAMAAIQQATQAGPQTLPGDQANLELNPIEKLVSFISGADVPSGSREGMNVGDHIQGVDRVGDMIAAKSQLLMEQNPLATAPSRPEWMNAKIRELQSPVDATPFQSGETPVQATAGNPAQRGAVGGREGEGILDSLDNYPSDTPVTGAGPAPLTTDEEVAQWISQFDPETLKRIRAQAYLKAQAGRLDAPTTREEEDAAMAAGLSPGGGGITSASGGPAYDKRMSDMQEFIDSQPARDAAWMVEHPRPGATASGADVLRQVAADKTAQRKLDAVNKLIQAGTGSSGKIPRDRAAQISMITGINIPSYMLSASPELVRDTITEISQQIQDQRMALASNITVAESGVAAQINEMAREKGAAVAVADRKLKKNVDPQEVYDELLASVASIDAKYASIIPASDSSGYNADKGNVEDVVVDENGRVLKRSGR